MINLSKVGDPYERRARLYPSLICLFPLMVGVYSSFPILYKTISGLVALAIAVGLLQLFSHLARDRGKRLESVLFAEWGGMPSVALFRHSDSNIPNPAKRRYHKMMSDETEIKNPTVELEATNPNDADEIYQSWSDSLRGKTRDSKKYPMVFKENVNYGFRRNLLGIKRYCILSGLIALVIILLPAYKSGTITQVQIGISFVELAYILVFIFVVRRSWVKITAYAYAKQLLESMNA